MTPYPGPMSGDHGLDGDEEFVRTEFERAARVPVDESPRVMLAGIAAGRILRSHRRRRNALGVVVVLGLVAGGSVALRSVTDDGGGTHPSNHSTSSGPVHQSPTGIAGELEGRGASVDWVAYAGTQVAAAGWRVCSTDPGYHGPCGGVMTRTDDGWASGRIVPGMYDAKGVVTTGGDVILVQGPYRATVLRADGSTRKIRVEHHPAPAQPGQALYGSGWSGLHGVGDLFAYDAKEHRAVPVPAAPNIGTRNGAQWGPGGRLWVEGWGANSQRVIVAWSNDGGASWSEHVVSAGYSYPGGLVVGASGQVVALASSGGGGSSLRNTSAITQDGGLTWQPFDRPNEPRRVSSEGNIGSASEVAELPDGRIFLVDGATKTLWTATGDWLSFERVPTPSPVTAIQTNGRLLWVYEADHRRSILVSTDGGQHWSSVIPQ